MYFKTVVAAAAAFLLAGQAMAAAEIATNPYAACNCPNNCKHKSGSSCKFYSGPSDTSPVSSGHCTVVGGSLTCVVS